jgi:hypothetical protein
MKNTRERGGVYILTQFDTRPARQTGHVCDGVRLRLRRQLMAFCGFLDCTSNEPSCILAAQAQSPAINSLLFDFRHAEIMASPLKCVVSGAHTPNQSAGHRSLMDELLSRTAKTAEIARAHMTLGRAQPCHAMAATFNTKTRVQELIFPFAWPFKQNRRQHRHVARW